MKIPFLGGSYSGRSTNVNSQRSINLFLEKDPTEAKDDIVMLGTPGLILFSALVAESTHTAVRELHVLRDTLYAVVGNQVYSVTTGGVATYLGIIDTFNGFVCMEDNGYQIIIVDGSDTGHYIETGVLYNITDPDFPTCSSAAQQDGYFIVTEKDTGNMFISGLRDVTTWDALDFAAAESDPDYALRVMSANRELWVFGEKTIEPFYNSGSADFPFERISGATIPCGVGAKASVAVINGVFYWLSDKGQIMCNSGYTPNKISTVTIDYQISTYNTISDARGYNFTLSGHTFYVLIFPIQNVTWMYDVTTGVWNEWESYYNKDEAIPWARHRSNCCVRFGNKEIVGDYENGMLYQLSMTTYTDNYNTIKRIRAAQFLSKDRVNLIYHNLEVEFEAGVGLNNEPSGVVTRANFKISPLNDSAFVDFGVAGALSSCLGATLIISDSLGNTITGYIGAVGTGETYSAEYFMDPTFDNAGMWAASNGWSIAGGMAIAVSGTGHNFINDTAGFPTRNALYKSTIVVNNVSGGGVGIRYGGGITNLGNMYPVIGSYTEYIVNKGTNQLALFRNVPASDLSECTSVSSKHVLTPSATGVNIVSTPGGAIKRWAIIHPSFNFNDMAGYTYTISRQGDDPQAMLDWSSDGGHTWSSEYWASMGGSLGNIGEYTKRARWNRLGMGRSRIFRLTISDPVKVVMLGAYAEIEETTA
jgi:hypothetical protein